MQNCVLGAGSGRGILWGRVVREVGLFFFFFKEIQNRLLESHFLKNLAGRVKTTLWCVAPPGLTWPPLCPLQGWFPVHTTRQGHPATHLSCGAAFQREPRRASAPATLCTALQPLAHDASCPAAASGLSSVGSGDQVSPAPQGQRPEWPMPVHLHRGQPR